MASTTYAEISYARRRALFLLLRVMLILSGFMFSDAAASPLQAPGQSSMRFQAGMGDRRAPHHQGTAFYVGNLADPAHRQMMVAARQTAHQQAQARAQGWADAHGLPMRIETNDIVMMLVDFTEELGPLYQTTLNVDAAISSAANLVMTGPYNLSGAGIRAGIWDGGNVRTSHVEFIAGNITNYNSTGFNSHATHVAGTMIARGADSNARGMATNASLYAYNFNNDLSEMTVRAMADPMATDGKIQLSNHSYGFVVGWASGNWSGTQGRHWFGTWGSQESDFFGMYIDYDKDLDQLVYDSLYYLPIRSAGNDRNDAAPGNGTTFYRRNTSGTWVSEVYDSSVHPLADFQKGGYNTIPFGAVAKNILLVGAVNDAVTSGERDLAKATQTTFSSWGPADDGRIKPDVVGNGFVLTSSGASSDTHYYGSSGTSMSAPNVSGSALLMLEHFNNLFPGEFMWASTIKGLIIHTADSLDDPGPDYRNGWGLMNTKAAVDHITAHFEAPTTGHMIEDVLVSGTTISYEVLWNETDDLRATLVWTDPAGTPVFGLNNTTPMLVNDLDLRIISPSGVTNFPWILDPANPSHAATTGDNNLDNVEQVYIADPTESGTYTIQIAHKGTLSGGEQLFSLLVSGITEFEALQLEGDLAFGDVQVNTEEQRILTLHNDNTIAVTVTNIALPFGFSTDFTGTLPGGSSKDVVISFAPTDLIPYGTELTLFTSESDAATITSVSGTGVDTLFISIDQPVDGTTLAYSNEIITVSGTAGSELTGLFSWENLDAAADGFVVAATPWNVPAIPLLEGTNLITVAGTNAPGITILAADSAAGSSWGSGDNGGNGFHAWILTATANAGHFVNSSGWGLWANSGGEANAYRPFMQPLRVGDSFDVRFDNNSIQVGGSVGIGLLNGNGEWLIEFHFIGGESNYRINDAITDRDTGVAFTSSGLDLTITLTSSTTYEIDIDGTLLTGTFAARDAMEPTRFRAWNSNAGSGSAHDFFVDDLTITAGAGTPVIASDSIEVVRLGPPPQLDPIPAQEVTVGDTLNYTVSATGQGPISFGVTTDVSTNRWSLNPSTGDFIFTPTQAEAGTVEFAFTATNDDDTSPPEIMTVTVMATPEFEPLGDQVADTGTPISFSVAATGHPVPVLSLDSTTASGGFTFTPASGLLEYTPPFADAGTQTFTFTAENSLGIATQAVDVVVTLTPPAAPTLWVPLTNAFDLVAEWTESEGATEYRLDVHTHPEFLNEVPGLGGFEDFEGIGEGSTFTTRIWTNSGVVWTGVNVRASDTIDGKAIGLQNNAGFFVSQPIPGGIDELSVDFKRASGGPPASFNLFVNETSYTTPNYNTSVQTLAITNIGVSGDFTIRIENAGNAVGVFDNLTWTNSSVPGGVFVDGYSNRTVAATTESVTGLEQVQTYYLRVKAVNAAGASPYSDTIESTTLLGMVRILSAEQTAMDGSGAVTIELEAFHPSAEAVDVEVAFSGDNGSSWTNAWIATATAGTIVNGMLQEVSVRDGGVPITNVVELIWSSTNEPALVGATGTLVRARGWDGTQWSGTSLSAPFLVDNTPPDAFAAWVSVPTSPFGPYTFSTVLTNTWGGFQDPLSGIAGYYIAFTDGGGTSNGAWTTNTTFQLTPPVLDENYEVFVWAADEKGNIGSSVTLAVAVVSEEGDYDGGGMRNRDKEIAGLSVIDPEAVFAGLPDDASPSAKPTVRWPWASDRIYTIYWTDGPLGAGMTWSSIELAEEDYTVVGATASWTDPLPLNGAGQPRYYRVKVRLAD